MPKPLTASQLLRRSRSPCFNQLVDTCLRVAPTAARVLLLGETGTGKELLARAIHEASGRPGRFVAINCGAVAEQLIEAELFGHEKGAFTGADRARVGLLRHADKGTLLLDEVGDMPLSIQASTLRVLEEGLVRPIGGRDEHRVDVRVLAATSSPLDRAVREGRFREDLLYRLDVIRIEVPPLRARREDVVPLFHHFCELFGRRHGVALPEIDPSFLEALRDHSWPGNIRQLANITERLLLTLRKDTRLSADDLSASLGSSDRLPQITPSLLGPPRPITQPTPEAAIRSDRPLEDVLDEVERHYLEVALRDSGGRAQETARRAGLSRRTLLRKLKKHGLERRDFT